MNVLTLTATQSGPEQEHWFRCFRIPTATLPSSPIQLSAETAEAADRQIRIFLKSQSERELHLIVPEAVVRSAIIRKRLSKEVQRHYSVCYCPASALLTLKPMPSLIHDTIISLVYKFMVACSRSGFLTIEEQDYICMGPAGTQLPRSGYRHIGSGKKISWEKDPDCALVFGRCDQKKIPVVMFEAGFSESHEDLVNDAHEWLQKSGGKVRLVILVNIDEDSCVLKERQASFECQHRIADLLNHYGNSLRRESNGLDTDCVDVESDISMYDDIERKIIDNDWVGPLSATIEVWCLKQGVPTCREGPIVLPPSLQMDPTIMITDLIPQEYQGLFNNFDPTRRAILDMNVYRNLLSDSMHSLAYNRALKYLRPRDKELDEEYSPSQSSRDSSS